jgi:hypothetical protein
MSKRFFSWPSLLGCLSFLMVVLLQNNAPWMTVSQAQGLPAGGYTVVVEVIAQQVYDRFPKLPKANEYRRQDNGEVDKDSTLISRMIRYHRDIKKRPTRYRFDWKLTLADYLGANEQMTPDRYPGLSTLTESPLEADRQLIASLNRQQRQGLVDFLAELYRPQTANASGDVNEEGGPTENPERPAVVKPSSPGLSQPGDAQLLMP